MTIRARRQTNASKQTTVLDGVDVGPPKQRVCWRGLNRSVHEAMNNISNVNRRVAEIQIFEKTYLIVIKDETGLKFKIIDSSLFLIGSYAQKFVASY